MPFYNIPNNARDFKRAFAYETRPERRRVIDLCVKVNELYEQGTIKDDVRIYPDGVSTKGSFLYYDDLVFVHTDKPKRGHAYYFFPTDTMKKPLRDDSFTQQMLNKILSYSYNRGLEDCIFWEFFSKPGEVWTSALSQAFALELFSLFSSFKPICEKILNGFDVDWRQGGVLDTKHNWYLEYPMIINPDVNDVRRVLNGHTETLIILYRYYAETKSERALTLFQRGCDALKELLPKFIAPDGRSFYSLWQATNSDPKVRDGSYGDRYHHLHVSDIYRIYTITDDQFFKDYVDKMMQQEPTYLPYYLMPYDVENVEHRVPDTACPNCNPEDICPGCLIDVEILRKFRP